MFYLSKTSGEGGEINSSSLALNFVGMIRQVIKLYTLGRDICIVMSKFFGLKKKTPYKQHQYIQDINLTRCRFCLCEENRNVYHYPGYLSKRCVHF